jgi:hypothetical protein
MILGFPDNLVLYYVSAAITINFAAILVLFAFNRKNLLKPYKSIQRRTWLILAAIVVLSAILRITVAHHQHLRYVDESWYLETADNFRSDGAFLLSDLEFADAGDCTLRKQTFMYSKQVGLPFLIVLASGVLGISEFTSIYLSLFLGILTIPLVFLWAYALFKDEELGLLASLMLAFFPIHVFYSGSGDTVVPGLFFVFLTAVAVMHYVQRPRPGMALLALFLFIFTVQMRFEYALLVFPFAYILSSSRKIPKKHLKYLAVAIPFIPSYIVQLLNEAGNVLSSGELRASNVHLLASHVVDATAFVYGNFPILILLFVLIGTALGIAKRSRPAFFLLLWSFVLVLLYPMNILQDRIILPVFPALMLIAAYGIVKSVISIKSRYSTYVLILVWAILILSLSLRLSSRAEVFYDDNAHAYSYLETRLPAQLEERYSEGIIVVAWPTMLQATTDLTVIRTGEALDHPEDLRDLLSRSEVYYLYDLACVHDAWEATVQECTVFMEAYDVSPVEHFTSPEAEIVLYRVTARKGD